MASAFITTQCMAEASEHHIQPSSTVQTSKRSSIQKYVKTCKTKQMGAQKELRK